MSIPLTDTFPPFLSHQGRPTIAHGFNRGLRVYRAKSPVGAKEKMGLNRRVLSSLTGLDSYSRHNPAMNRWAILERPCGTGTGLDQRRFQFAIRARHHRHV